MISCNALELCKTRIKSFNLRENVVLKAVTKIRTTSKNYVQ